MKTIILSALLLPLSLLIVSCGGAAVGVGQGNDSTASIYIKSTDTARTKAAVREVFAEEGFNYRGKSSSGQTLYFQKVGGRAAYIAWGGWGGDEVMISPEVYLAQGANGIRLDCDLYISRYSEYFGESGAHRPWGAGRSAYRGVLRKIKKRVEQ